MPLSDHANDVSVGFLRPSQYWWFVEAPAGDSGVLSRIDEKRGRGRKMCTGHRGVIWQDRAIYFFKFLSGNSDPDPAKGIFTAL